MSNEQACSGQYEPKREDILHLISRQQIEYSHKEKSLNEIKELIGMLPVNLTPDQEKIVCNIAIKFIQNV